MCSRDPFDIEHNKRLVQTVAILSRVLNGTGKTFSRLFCYTVMGNNILLISFEDRLKANKETSGILFGVIVEKSVFFITGLMPPLLS